MANTKKKNPFSRPEPANETPGEKRYLVIGPQAMKLKWRDAEIESFFLEESFMHAYPVVAQGMRNP